MLSGKCQPHACPQEPATKWGRKLEPSYVGKTNSEVSVETIRVESPRRREVMIEVAACGVCPRRSTPS